MYMNSQKTDVACTTCGPHSTGQLVFLASEIAADNNHIDGVAGSRNENAAMHIHIDKGNSLVHFMGRPGMGWSSSSFLNNGRVFVSRYAPASACQRYGAHKKVAFKKYR